MNIILYYAIMVVVLFLVLLYISIKNKKEGKTIQYNEEYNSSDLYLLDTFEHINSGRIKSITEGVSDGVNDVVNIDTSQAEELNDGIDDEINDVHPLTEEVDVKPSIKKIKNSTKKVASSDTTPLEDTLSEIQTTDKVDMSLYTYRLTDISNGELFTSTEQKIIVDKINDSLLVKMTDILIIINNKTNSIDDIIFDSYSELKQKSIIEKVKLYITKEKNQFTFIYIAPFGLIKGYLNDKIKLDRLVL